MPTASAIEIVQYVRFSRLERSGEFLSTCVYYYYYYDRSEAEKVLFTNILEALVGEPARRPDSDAFQTLISWGFS